MADIDRLLDRLAEDEAGDDTARERVTRAVGVDNVRRVDLGRVVGVRLVLALHRADRRLGAVGDEHGAGRVHLRGRVGDRLRDLTEVARLEARGLRPRLGLGLVADDQLGVGQDLVDLRLEELGNERRREVERERLAGLLGVLRDNQRALDTVGEEEAADVEELGGVDRGLGLGRVEVRLVELLSRTEVGAQRAVVLGDHHSARAGGRRVDHLVERLETLAVVCRAELLCEVVVADRTEVGRRVLREHVLRAARRVLRGAARDVGHLVVLDEVLVDRQLLLRREHRVVGLQAVLFEHGLAIADLHVQQRVTKRNELQSSGVDHDGF